MKGLFIPGITAEMFRNASVESVVELMAEGKIHDIDYKDVSRGDSMTREEAINILNRDDDSMRKGYFCINDFTAIEVLKSQEPCNDCISREKVFKMIDTCNSDGLKDVFYSYADGERFKEYIKKLPSVQPKEKGRDEKSGRMTQEEAKQIVSNIDKAYRNFTSDEYTALKMAIKALEQEPILDKIRAEIDVARFIDKDTRHCRNALASGLEVALDIIDKHKAESEE